MKTTFHLAPDDGERSMIIRSLNNLRSSLILIRKQNRPKAKNLSLKSQQILFRKSQQQLNKVKNLIYRIGFITLRIILKVLD